MHEIWITGEIGPLTGYAVLESEGLQKILVQEYPYDFENWSWDGQKLSRIRPKITFEDLRTLQQMMASLTKKIILPNLMKDRMIDEFPDFKDIKQFYEWGCYSYEDLTDYSDAGYLTENQIAEIIGVNE